MSIQREPMTQEGYDNEKAKLDRMQNVEMIEIAERIATARAMGDLSENAEYQAAREDQGMLQARIDSLKDRLARAVIVDPATLSTDILVFGMRVRIKNIDSGDEEIYQIVGPGQEDYEQKKILATSPRAQMLLGRKVGDTTEIKLPRGLFRYKIMEITPAL